MCINYATGLQPLNEHVQTARAVQIKIFFMARVLDKSTPMMPEIAINYSVAQKKTDTWFSFNFVVQQQFEMSQNASEILIKQCCKLQNSHPG